MTKRNIQTRNNAKTLRTEMTPPEAKLWSILRGSRLEGIKFVRQMVFGPHYIADFAARSHRLVIELDGDSHAGNEAQDAARTVYMESKGYKVVRFANRDVFENPEGVARMILAAIGRDWP
ncbi:endonuclease domain-containing protein [Sphingorhabdus sp.]|uniref:endonuclease domain-containing protein n=1 Tax=Sphingorhabdus sp. TaxID=1902408 RepID=UPI003D81400A